MEIDRKEIAFRLISVFPNIDWRLLKDFIDGRKDPIEVLDEVSRHAEFFLTRRSRGGFYYYRNYRKQ
jgi:hypothetical protein